MFFPLPCWSVINFLFCVWCLYVVCSHDDDGGVSVSCQGYKWMCVERNSFTMRTNWWYAGEVKCNDWEPFYLCLGRSARCLGIFTLSIIILCENRIAWALACVVLRACSPCIIILCIFLFLLFLCCSIPHVSLCLPKRENWSTLRFSYDNFFCFSTGCWLLAGARCMREHVRRYSTLNEMKFNVKNKTENKRSYDERWWEHSCVFICVCVRWKDVCQKRKCQRITK